MKKALIGSHDDMQREYFTMIAEMRGYSVTNETSYAGMISRLDQKPDRVIMDVNLGRPGSLDYTPIKEVDKARKERGYNDDRTSLLGITGHTPLAMEITSTGIPAIAKPFTIEKLPGRCYNV